MSHGGLLQELVIVYAVALALLVVAGRLSVPPIVALILSGVITGPAGLRIVGTQADVEMLAEIGIAVLLFTAGLDFSVSGLRRTWGRVVFGGTAGQQPALGRTQQVQHCEEHGSHDESDRRQQHQVVADAGVEYRGEEPVQHRTGDGSGGRRGECAAHHRQG